MTNIVTLQELQSGKPFPPQLDLVRQTEIEKNRNLYEGRLQSLGIIDTTQPQSKIFPIRNNWFRRIPEFYAEFCFSDTPEITLGNSRGDDLVKSSIEALMASYKLALIDYFRYGTGVVYLDEQNDIRPAEPNCWFRLYNENKSIQIGDVIACAQNQVTAVPDTSMTNETSAYLDIWVLPFEGEVIHTRHRYSGGNIGAIIFSNKFGSRGVPSVFPIMNGYPTGGQGQSIYPDIREGVGEIARRLTGLSAILSNNERPHLYGPASSVAIDINGKPTISADGQFFPLQPEDKAPGYLQWDSDIEAVKASIRWNEDQILNATGLSKLLFSDTGDDQSVFSNTSGETLKRIMLPFYAKINNIKNSLETSVKDLIVSKSQVMSGLGGEVITVDRNAIEIEWPFLNIFTDGQAPMREGESGASIGNDSESGGTR